MKFDLNVPEDLVQDPKTVVHFLVEMVSERARQETLRAAGKFPFTCAAAGVPHAHRFAILSEEVGEIARHVTEGLIEAERVDQDKLREELIQVAAVCCAWAEGIDFEKASRARL